MRLKGLGFMCGTFAVAFSDNNQGRNGRVSMEGANLAKPRVTAVSPPSGLSRPSVSRGD